MPCRAPPDESTNDKKHAQFNHVFNGEDLLHRFSPVATLIWYFNTDLVTFNFSPPFFHPLEVAARLFFQPLESGDFGS
jgi:hypothetical protein